LFVGPYTQEGTADLQKHFDRDVFPFPKPVALVRKLLDLKFSTTAQSEEEIILDFFGGSATVAEAVIEQTAFDHCVRKLIMIQLPEPTEEKSVAQLKGFSSIADIGRARFGSTIDIHTKNADLATQAPANLGFKSFRLTPSNFKQWRGDGIDTPEQLAEQMLMFAKSEKEGAAVEHMLYELLLKFGQELTTPVETLDVAGGKVYAIHGRKMLFVLESFTDAMIQPLVELKPREIIAIDGVFLDSDPLKSNLDLQCRDVGIKFTCL
jgi:adenine-specific DNA-methyltransferase